MIIPRLVHVCRITLASVYAFSFLLSCMAFPLFILAVLEEHDYLDRVETRTIVCTTRDKADGISMFHGEAYVRPSISQLEQMRLICEDEKQRLEATDRYYSNSSLELWLLYDDCNKVGAVHQADAQKNYDNACNAKKHGTEVQSNTRIRSKIVNTEVENLLTLMLKSIPITFILYLLGYIFFGEKTAFPLRKFKNIRTPE